MLIQKSNYLIKICEIQKNVEIENYLPDNKYKYSEYNINKYNNIYKYNTNSRYDIFRQDVYFIFCF